MTNMLIWDGNDFRILPEKEAKQLVSEDKAQFAEGLQGTQLKFREEFSGYSNKMMVTGKPANEQTKKPASEKPKTTAKPKTVPSRKPASTLKKVVLK